MTKFDAAEYLDDELQALYLDEVAKENDPSALIKAIDTVARAKGMTKTAKETGIYREGLSKALSQNGNPSFATVCKILNTKYTEPVSQETELQGCSIDGNLDSTESGAGGYASNSVKGTSLGRYHFCHKITQVAGHRSIL